MTTEFGFTLHKQDGHARRGTVHTGRGDIRTPAFMPVGTVGTVKGLYLDQVKGTGADIILGNTYHLMLRPGAEEVAALGGLHHFIGWNSPILTDSGGFQIMSLSKIRKITERGAMFQSRPNVPWTSSGCWGRTSKCSSTSASSFRIQRSRR
jgi:queuine tRNA-ribosyltransferase